MKNKSIFEKSIIKLNKATEEEVSFFIDDSFDCNLDFPQYFGITLEEDSLFNLYSVYNKNTKNISFYVEIDNGIKIDRIVVDLYPDDKIYLTNEIKKEIMKIESRSNYNNTELILSYEGFLGYYLTKKKSKKFFKNSSYQYVGRNNIYSYSNANATFVINKYNVIIYIHEDNDKTYELIEDYIVNVFSKENRWIANNIFYIVCSDLNFDIYNNLINSNKIKEYLV